MTTAWTVVSVFSTQRPQGDWIVRRSNGHAPEYHLDANLRVQRYHTAGFAQLVANDLNQKEESKAS